MNKRNYMKELSEIQREIGYEIEAELKRLDRNFFRDDKEPLEFFSYRESESMIQVGKDGTIKIVGILENISIRSLLDNGDLDIYNAASLLSELRKLS